MSYTFNITGSLLPILAGKSSSLPLSFGKPTQPGNGKLQCIPFENIMNNKRLTKRQNKTLVEKIVFYYGNDPQSTFSCNDLFEQFIFTHHL